MFPMGLRPHGRQQPGELCEMKKHLSTIILILILLAGLSLLLYPTVSNWWNLNHTTRAISSYNAVIEEADTSTIDTMWDEAVEYNRLLAGGKIDPLYDEAVRARYKELLDASGLGIMGYIEIPSVNITLPIYHGTDESVLMVGIGHIDWSSLPTGGTSTHCVISGHRGLTSAKLFTDIDRLVEGDIFLLNVLNKEMTYEVDQILIVLPEELEATRIEPGQDLVTLVTCTPYGVNSHRLLVRGHRIENRLRDIRVTADAVQIRPVVVAPFVAAPILLVLLVLLFVDKRTKDDYDD